LVINLTEASAGAMLSIYARRWGIEVTIKELKSGLHLGQMQGTKEAAGVTRSVALSVVADLVLVRLYGHEEARARAWSLVKLAGRVTEDVAQEHMRRSALRWQRKLKQTQGRSVTCIQSPVTFELELHGVEDLLEGFTELFFIRVCSPIREEKFMEAFQD